LVPVSLTSLYFVIKSSLQQLCAKNIYLSTTKIIFENLVDRTRKRYYYSSMKVNGGVDGHA
jgi:hypothetical protein